MDIIDAMTVEFKTFSCSNKENQDSIQIVDCKDLTVKVDTEKQIETVWLSD